MESYIPTSVDQYVEIFFKRKKLFLIPFVTVLVLAGILFPVLPKLYQSTAILTVTDETLLNPIVHDGSNRNQRTSPDKKIQAIKLAVLSPNRLVPLMKDLKLVTGEEDSRTLKKRVSKLAKRVDIKPVEGLIEVTYEDRDPKSAQLVTNAIAKEFVEINQREKMDEAQRAVAFIENQLRMYHNKLQDSEKTFYASQIGNELQEAMKRRSVLMEQISRTPRSVSYGGSTGDGDINKLRSELIAAQSQLKQLLFDSRRDNPMIQELREKITDLENRIQLTKESIEEMGDDSLPSSNPAYDQVAVQLKEIDLQIESLRRKQSALQSGTLEIRGATVEELASLERDKSVNEDIYQSLLRNLENAQMVQRLGAQGQGSPFKLLAAGGLPNKPSKPNPLHVAGGAIFLALLAGAGAVFCREFFDSSFRGVNDAKSYLKFPMLAFIPRILVGTNGNSPRLITAGAASGTNGHAANGANGHSRPHRDPKNSSLTYMAHTLRDAEIAPQIVAFHDPESLPAEYYRLLRTQILSMRQKMDLQSIMVTSTLEGEGKSTTSLNMASLMASELNQRVLLMDCDLRKGTVARLLGLPQAGGLSEYLSAAWDVNAIIRKSKIERLSVITSGKNLPNPARLLASGAMGRLMEDLRSRFDIIVMDAPPVLHLSDVPMLMHHADGIVMVVQAGRTRRELVQNAHSILQQTKDAKVLGYVLTQVDQTLPPYMQQYLYGGYYV